MRPPAVADIRRPVRIPDEALGSWHHASMSYTTAQDAFFSHFFSHFPVHATDAGNHQHNVKRTIEAH